MNLTNPIQILLIEDEEYDVRRVRKTLEPFNEQLIIKKVVADGESALELLRKNKNEYDVIIMDYQIVGGTSGKNLIRKIKQIEETLQIIVITKMTVNITDFEFANELLEAGAMWYCTKYPGDIEEYIYQPTDFILSIFNAYEKKVLEKEKLKSYRKLEQSVDRVLEEKKIIGDSEAIVKLRNKIEKAAQQDATILIYGASGTGKELVANNIHYRSKRRMEKFIAINSGSLPNELIESELFGFAKGSFTGANAEKTGLFQLANKGTIFLDEVGELPATAQVKLLRVLQEGELDRIGRTTKVNVNVRVIAATNINLRDAIEVKKFREDLFYRLNVINIYVPSLKERKEDIPQLLHYFINKFCDNMSIPVPAIDQDAITQLQHYPWPGNVRQLQNVVQRMLFSCEDKISIDDVEEAVGGKREVKDTFIEKNLATEIIPWKKMEKNLKKKYFSFVRSQTKSDSEAARKLGLAPSNYYRTCKDLGIK
ncbi:MAG: sigma-54 dependent transcriptional regulator [Calditrichaceae bacterium]|jgi:two-component system, NtrC family, response regulator AtoC